MEVCKQGSLGCPLGSYTRKGRVKQKQGGQRGGSHEPGGTLELGPLS